MIYQRMTSDDGWQLYLLISIYELKLMDKVMGSDLPSPELKVSWVEFYKSKKDHKNDLELVSVNTTVDRWEEIAKYCKLFGVGMVDDDKNASRVMLIGRMLDVCIECAKDEVKSIVHTLDIKVSAQSVP